MLAEIFLFFAGIFLGILTGLIPGLHTNTVCAILIAFLPLELKFFGIVPLIIFVVSLSITNLFLDFIPTSFLGAPEEESCLSTMPAHELLVKGKGHYAVFLSALGSFGGMIIFLLLILPCYYLFTNFYSYIEFMIPWALFWVLVLLVFDRNNFLWTSVTFCLASFLGIFSLNCGLKEPLLPLLGGLFGVSSMIISISQKVSLPEQSTKISGFEKKKLVLPGILCFFVSPFCGFLPGLSSSQATAICSKIYGKMDREQFLVLNGAFSVCVGALSLLAVYLIDKSRTGFAAAVREIGNVDRRMFILICVVCFVSAILGFLLTIFFSKLVAKRISRINYPLISKITLCLVVGIVVCLSGWKGILVLFSSTCVGILCHLTGVRKGVMICCLIVPTFLFYFPF